MAYAMSHQRGDVVQILLAQLATNQAVFRQLVEAGQSMLEQEEAVLHQIAEQALLDASKRDGAIMQLGRVEMMRSLLQYTARYLKS